MTLAEPAPPVAAPSDDLKALALRWAADAAYLYLVEAEEPVAGRELLPVVNDILRIGPKALKRALELDPRIARHERRWITHNEEVDPRRPLERSVTQLIERIGLPLLPEAIAQQLAAGYSREETALMNLVDRLVETRNDFIEMDDQRIAVASWLIDPSAGDPAEIEFENFEETDELDLVRPFADALTWEGSTLQDGAVRLLDAVNGPISNKVLQFFMVRARPERFNPQAHLKLLFTRDDTTFLSPAMWIGPKTRATLQQMLEDLESTLQDVELTNDDVPRPITVEPEDVDAMVELLSTVPTRSAELLSMQFADLRADDPNYHTTYNSLDKALRSDERFMWVGWDRWTTPQPIPNAPHQFPASLTPIVVDVELSAGQQEDVELEDEGLEGSLAKDLNHPLVKTGGQITRNDDGTLRAVTTNAVHEAGVFPIGEDGAIFPRQPDFLLVTLVGKEGTIRQHWVNNRLGMMFNMAPWYTELNLPRSGAIFTLTPQSGPGHYLIETDGSTDPETYLDANRVKDLQTLRDRALAQETSTREILQEILGHHSKGISFPELYAEVIVARMSSGRMVASILSAYYEFYTKGSLWLFNARDVGKGFKKTRKKYLIRR